MEQWDVARAMRELVVERFEQLGIEIPLPQQVVWHRNEDSVAEERVDAPKT